LASRGGVSNLRRQKGGRKKGKGREEGKSQITWFLNCRVCDYLSGKKKGKKRGGKGRLSVFSVERSHGRPPEVFLNRKGGGEGGKGEIFRLRKELPSRHGQKKKGKGERKGKKGKALDLVG